MSNRSTSGAPRAPKPVEERPYHHGALRETLLDAAEAWLDARGIQDLTLRELAKAAGVSHAAPYHHFAGRDELLACVAERAFVRLGNALAAASAAASTSRAALLDIGAAYVRVALEHPARFRLMFGPTLAGKDAHAGLKAAAERAFGVLLAAARAQDPMGGVELALAGWSLAHGVANLAIDGAFSGLPLSPARARAIAQRDPATLVRRMAEGLLGDKAGTVTGARARARPTLRP
jgi:AcrR family transcriptional regulator